MNEHEVVVQISDIRQLKMFLQSALNYHQADDIMRAQKLMREVRPTPIAVEAERLLERVTHILGTHLLELEEMAAESASHTESDPEIEHVEPQSAMLKGPDLTKRKQMGLIKDTPQA